MGRLSLRALPGFLAVALLAQGGAAAPIDVTYSVSGFLAAGSGCIGCGFGVPVAGTLTVRLPGGDPSVGGAIDLEGIVTILGGQLATTGDPLRLYVGPDDEIVEITEIPVPGGASAHGTFFEPLTFLGAQGFRAVGDLSGDGTIQPGSIVLDEVYFNYPFGVTNAERTDEAVGFLQGTEVSRTLVPEPGVASLVGFGSLLGLAAVRAGVQSRKEADT
jgi:hypothetical protein